MEGVTSSVAGQKSHRDVPAVGGGPSGNRVPRPVVGSSAPPRFGDFRDVAWRIGMTGEDELDGPIAVCEEGKSFGTAPYGGRAELLGSQQLWT